MQLCRKPAFFISFLILFAACSRQPATPPDEVGATGAPARGTVQSADGVSIVYETRGTGDTAVLFVHCWSCNRHFWRHQVEPVSAAGYQVVTLDLPGHGESGSNRATWSIEGLAADVLAVADELGLRRIVLVGHSMGGPVSLAVAAHDPDRVRGIACVDTLQNADFKWPEGMTEQITGQLRGDFRKGLEGFVPQLFKPDADPEVVRWVVDQGVESDHTATIALMRDFPALDQPAMFSAAGVPIRCINAAPEGDQGMATAVDINRKYADFDVVMMEGVGHYPQLERPEEFNAKLLEVLATLSSSD